MTHSLARGPCSVPSSCLVPCVSHGGHQSSAGSADRVLRGDRNLSLDKFSPGSPLPPAHPTCESQAPHQVQQGHILDVLSLRAEHPDESVGKSLDLAVPQCFQL